MTEHKIVFIKRVPKVYHLHKEGDIEQGIWKIGSSLKQNGPLRGLTFAEEARFLPSILGIANTSEKFSHACNDYWNKISTVVPSGEGLQLEVGWEWKNEADYNDEKNKEESLRTKGQPINMADYILYRYCLVYGRVANKEEDINKSSKIKFYLHTKEAKIKAEKAKNDVKKQAMKLYLELLGDRNKIMYILRVDDTNLDIDTMDNDEIDIALNKFLENKPSKLIEIANNPDLSTLALIHEALRTNHLERMSNTETITYGTVVVGNTMKEAVTNLKSNTDNFKLIRNKLEAALNKFVPTPVAAKG